MIVHHQHWGVWDRRIHIRRQMVETGVIVQPPHGDPHVFASMLLAVDFARERWPGRVLAIHC